MLAIALKFVPARYPLIQVVTLLATASAVSMRVWVFGLAVLSACFLLEHHCVHCVVDDSDGGSLQDANEDMSSLESQVSDSDGEDRLAEPLDEALKDVDDWASIAVQYEDDNDVEEANSWRRYYYRRPARRSRYRYRRPVRRSRYRYRRPARRSRYRYRIVQHRRISKSGGSKNGGVSLPIASIDPTKPAQPTVVQQPDIIHIRQIGLQPYVPEPVQTPQQLSSAAQVGQLTSSWISNSRRRRRRRRRRRG